MFVLCYFFNIDMYIFDKINLLTYLLTYYDGVSCTFLEVFTYCLFAWWLDVSVCVIPECSIAFFVTAGDSLASGQRSAALLAWVAHQSGHTDNPHLSDLSHAGQGMSNVSSMHLVALWVHMLLEAILFLVLHLSCVFHPIALNYKQHHLTAARTWNFIMWLEAIHSWQHFLKRMKHAFNRSSPSSKSLQSSFKWFNQAAEQIVFSYHVTYIITNIDHLFNISLN